LLRTSTDLAGSGKIYLARAMGWFDGDSSDEEDISAKKKPLLLSLDGRGYDDVTNDAQSAAATNSQNQHQKEEEDEEDPLDAYMNSLNKPELSRKDHGDISTKSSNSTQDKACRLDLDNEDEATSHWQEVDHTNISHQDESDSELDPSGLVKRSTAAKRELQKTFVKAGSSASSGQPRDDDSDEDLSNKRSKRMDIHLNQIDHQQMQYEAFEKVFWNPPTIATSSAEKDRAWRQERHITLQGSNGCMLSPIYEFADIKEILDESLFHRIQSLGYQRPTPVQAQTLPVALNGRDALITAPTGSGKTLAYVWPMVVHVCAQRHLESHETGPIGLILVPTRELAQQVQKHVQTMLIPLGGTSLTIIGGMGKYPLTQHLRQKGGVEIVVATPGRLLDVLATKQQQEATAAAAAAATSFKKKLHGLSLERTTMVVLDESDRLLHMGFSNQVTQILQNIRPNRQTLMLSATMSHRIERVAQQWLVGDTGENNRGIGGRNAQSDYVRIAIGRTGQASLHVQQHVMVVPSAKAKLSWLQQMIPVLCQVGRTLVFCATKDGCEQLAQDLLLPEDITCVTLHGDKHQSDRNAALRKFVKQQRVILIATDVASRGLDIPQVTTVVNYDPPKSLDVHVHRVGRAGRLSASKCSDGQEQEQQQPNEGAAYTLLRTPKDADIGQVLLGAMERENRLVSEELRQLAALSRHHRGGSPSHKQDRWSKEHSHSNIVSTSHPSSKGTSYYGPPADQPQKKSRWS